MEVKVILCFLLIFLAYSQTQAGSRCFLQQAMFLISLRTMKILSVFLGVVSVDLFTVSDATLLEGKQRKKLQ